VASIIANVLLEAATRLPAAIPAAPAPTIKTSKSGSERKSATAGQDIVEINPATALRRVTLVIGSEKATASDKISPAVKRLLAAYLFDSTWHTNKQRHAEPASITNAFRALAFRAHRTMNLC
jgi:hypothetical protein